MNVRKHENGNVSMRNVEKTNVVPGLSSNRNRVRLKSAIAGAATTMATGVAATITATMAAATR